MDQQIETIRNIFSTPNDGIGNEPPFKDKIMRAPLP